jgi:hypothetical protein
MRGGGGRKIKECSSIGPCQLPTQLTALNQRSSMDRSFVVGALSRQHTYSAAAAACEDTRASCP